MARSNAIWVIFYGKNRDFVAAFTVRHELCTWLYREPDEDFTQLTGVRAADGAHSSLSVLDLDHLRAEGKRMAEAEKARRARKHANPRISS
jgi:hypothetical protein